MTDKPEFRMYRCGACGFVYNERVGLPDEGILPGTKWEDLPADWTCPDCSSAKEDFELNQN